MKYYPTIGLEIHAELKTDSKMFCSCKNDPDAKDPNTNVCPICMGHPGTLPVINEEAVRKVIKTGLALNCKISSKSKFDRKSYFYPDLPKGYQISQYDKPFCTGGFLEALDREIEITRIHLEEDTGRLIHPAKGDCSLVDFNRAGVPLMELVTEPDIKSAKEARAFAENLRLILRYLNVSTANMEKGQMRVEVNISLSKDKKLGTKVEIKNLNSFRAVGKSIEYEIERQTMMLEKKKKIIQETRGWDEKKAVTVSQRKKEEAHDYRYLPEPDLPTINLTNDFVQKIKGEIPELPKKRQERLTKEYGLDNKTADIFTVNKDLGEFFENVASELRNWIKDIDSKRNVEEKEYKKLAKLASNYIITDLQALLNGASVEDKKFLITAENFAEFVALIYKGKILSKVAKQVIAKMFNTGADPSHIIQEEGLSQLEDESEIEKIIKDIIKKNPKAVEDYNSGKEQAIQFLVGQVMAVTKGRVNPDTAKSLLKENI